MSLPHLQKCSKSFPGLTRIWLHWLNVWWKQQLKLNKLRNLVGRNWSQTPFWTKERYYFSLFSFPVNRLVVSLNIQRAKKTCFLHVVFFSPFCSLRTTKHTDDRTDWLSSSREAAGGRPAGVCFWTLNFIKIFVRRERISWANDFWWVSLETVNLEFTVTRKRSHNNETPKLVVTGSFLHSSVEFFGERLQKTKIFISCRKIQQKTEKTRITRFGIL